MQPSYTPNTVLYGLVLALALSLGFSIYLLQKLQQVKKQQSATLSEYHIAKQRSEFWEQQCTECNKKMASDSAHLTQQLATYHSHK